MSSEGGTTPAPAATTAVQVYIFNQTYTLRSASDEEHVRRVARLVDERMRRVAALAPNHDALKIAVLVALHLTEELELLRESPDAVSPGGEGDEQSTEERPAGGEEAEAREADPSARSWFEDVFDSEFEGHNRGEGGGRLSARLSERLQTRKPVRRQPMTLDTDETE
jgi:cell division protein ZapA (FtsZ GTPase activity inhibitor)